MKLLKSLPLMVVLAAIALVSFGATAFAAGTAVSSTDSSSLLDLLKPVFDAFSGGHYAYAAALLVVAAVALAKRYLSEDGFFHTNAGGSLLALLAAAALAISSALAAPGAHVTLALLKSALLVGVGAAGGYAVLKNLLVDPILVPLSKKAPAWAQPIFTVLFLIFDHSAPSDAIAEATKAGDAAVAAKPATGIAGAVKPTELK